MKQATTFLVFLLQKGSEEKRGGEHAYAAGASSFAFMLLGVQGHLVLPGIAKGEQPLGSLWRGGEHAYAAGAPSFAFASLLNPAWHCV